MQIIMADYHHNGLFNSLKLLAKRLDADIYRPIGRSWFNEGYFKIAEPYNNHPDTITQFLSEEPFEAVPFYANANLESYGMQGLYKIPDPANESTDWAITLELFKAITVDVLLVTYAPHLLSWIQLRDKYQPNAKIVLQVGNHGWESYYPLTKNLLSSCRHASRPDVPNYIEYHQEFDTDVFRPGIPSSDNSITSFVNCLPEEGYVKALANLLPEYVFKFHGAACPDGAITGVSTIAAIMRSSKFGLHIKPGGDGYGHVLHNWFACGVPIIADFSYYRGKMGGDLLTPLTGFDTAGMTPGQVATMIMNCTPDAYWVMRQQVQKKFSSLVNFDKEFYYDVEPFFQELQ